MGGISADTFNPFGAPPEILSGKVRKWQARDDVFQIGQILAMLIKGNADERIKPREVADLACGEALKEVIQRCIGERRKRFESAEALRVALGVTRVRLRLSRVRSLKGWRVVFTGRLAQSRERAKAVAERGGAIVQQKVSADTDVLVRGLPTVGQHAGRLGIKLMDARRLKRVGGKIRVISEENFWRVVGRPSRRH